MRPDDAVRLVTDRAMIRVYSFADPEAVMAEGRVIAYLDQPSLTIEDDEGNRSTWLITAPIDVERRTWERL